MSQPVVSIRELKSRLSHFLKLTRRGESVLITDRGVPVGRIVPVGQDLGQRIDALRAAGLLAWSGRRLPRRKSVMKVKGRKTVAQLLVDDRG